MTQAATARPGRTFDTIPRPVRVMIVDDSRVIRELLTRIIAKDSRLEVVAAVESGEAALDALLCAAPDVISMDIRLPGIDGFETTRRIMIERPTPIVVVAGDVGQKDLMISMNALRAGALSVLEKPNDTDQGDFIAFADLLCTQLAIMSQVKVIRHRRALRTAPARADRLDPSAHAPSRAGRSLSPPRPLIATREFELLGVVASTGGPNALVEVLNGLPSGFPIPILVVQHMTSSFSRAFVEWLDDVCMARVLAARDRMPVEAGTIYVAPADVHLTIDGRRLRLDDSPPVCMQRPSGTALFRSMARAAGPAAIGVLLTGMGEDGAEGLREIRARGGYTIAEDESTAVVYGMPGAAVALGAVCESIPLPRIAPRLRGLIRPEIRET